MTGTGNSAIPGVRLLHAFVFHNFSLNGLPGPVDRPSLVSAANIWKKRKKPTWSGLLKRFGCRGVADTIALKLRIAIGETGVCLDLISEGDPPQFSDDPVPGQPLMGLFHFIGDETFGSEEANILPDHSRSAWILAKPGIVFLHRVEVTVVNAGVRRNARHPMMLSKTCRGFCEIR